jgi:DNA modification methylase
VIPYYEDVSLRLYHADCLNMLRELPDCSVDAVVTDPPYGLAEHRRSNIEAALLAWLTGDREHVPDGRGFMGREWDRFVPPPAVWDECFRVLKPGGHLLAFAGARTVDLMGISIRLAGLTTDTSPQIRDSIAWLYGSGFPKSLDVGRSIDSSLCTEPGRHFWTVEAMNRSAQPGHVCALTEEGDQHRHEGTALKPAFEPIIVARKPLAGTVAASVLAHGTGALNIAGCRVGDTVETWPVSRSFASGISPGYTEGITRGETQSAGEPPAGRWPANVALDESQAAELDRQSGFSKSPPVGSVAVKAARLGQVAKGDEGARVSPNGHGDSGGASRFFPTFRYKAKAPASERPKGKDGSAHSTVKPLDLMRWLVRLVTPPGGVVLEPFAGSGTTVEACLLEGFRCIAVEREAAYLPLILQRIARAQPPQDGLFEAAG